MGMTREEAFEQGKLRWPGVELGFSAWCAQLDELGEEVPPHAESVFLCCACALGDAAAWDWLEREFFPGLRGALAQRYAAPDFVEEVLQLTRQRLLEGRPPKIATYSGEGKLRAWLTITAVRVAVDQKRHEAVERRRARALEELWGEVGCDLRGPSGLGAEYARLIERCLSDAIEALPTRDRALVRLYYLEGSSIDVIGKFYAVDRSNAARWIAACRERLRDDLRQRVERAFGPLNDSEFGSLVRMVYDEIDLSLSLLVRSRAEDGN